MNRYRWLHRRRARTFVIVALAIIGFVAMTGCESRVVSLQGDLSIATQDGTTPAPGGVAVALFSDATETIVSQTFTDSAGRYSFDTKAAPSGPYRLRFGDGSFFDGATRWVDATTVQASTEPATRIDAIIEAPTAILRGRVTRRSGRPVVGATVSLKSSGSKGPVASTTTTSDGTYALNGLSAMDATVGFTAGGQATDATPVTLDGSSEVAGIDAVLDPEGRIFGQFAGSTAGWDGVHAAAYDRSSGVLVATAPVNQYGDFTIGGLATGEYTVGLIDVHGRFANSVIGASSPEPTSGRIFVVTAGATTRIGQHPAVGADCPVVARGGTFLGADFSGANLTGCDFGGALVEGVDFSGADLSGATLTGARLRGASFDHAQLRGASLFVADASAADFSGAALFRANFRAAAVTGARFTGADLAGVRSGDLVGTPATLPAGWGVAAGLLMGPGADLSGAVFAGMDLSGWDLHGATIRSANLTGADLTGANLAGADVSNTDFTGAIVTGANLSAARVHGAEADGLVGVPAAMPAGVVVHKGVWFGPGAQVTGADVDGLDLSGANLVWIVSGSVTGTPTALPPGWALVDGFFVGPGAAITGADIGGADLSAVSLHNTRTGGITGVPAALPAGFVLHNGFLVGRGAALAHADLAGLSASGIDLRGTNLMWADLAGADLSGANLAGAHLDVTDLSGTNLSGADLTGAAIPRANLAGTDFTGARLTKLYSNLLVGEPRSLPPGHMIAGGALLGPGAEAAHVDLSGASLAGLDLSTGAFMMGDWSSVDLSGTDLSGANLSGVVLTGATVSGVDLSGAILDDVVADDLVGVPAVLPPGWIIQAGVLIPPNG